MERDLFPVPGITAVVRGCGLGLSSFRAGLVTRRLCRSKWVVGGISHAFATHGRTESFWGDTHRAHGHSGPCPVHSLIWLFLSL